MFDMMIDNTQRNFGDRASLKRNEDELLKIFNRTPERTLEQSEKISKVYGIS